jgi:hypothetical protein
MRSSFGSSRPSARESTSATTPSRPRGTRLSKRCRKSAPEDSRHAGREDVAHVLSWPLALVESVRRVSGAAAQSVRTRDAPIPVAARPTAPKHTSTTASAQPLAFRTTCSWSSDRAARHATARADADRPVGRIGRLSRGRLAWLTAGPPCPSARSRASTQRAIVRDDHVRVAVETHPSDDRSPPRSRVVAKSRSPCVEPPANAALSTHTRGRTSLPNRRISASLALAPAVPLRSERGSKGENR